MVIHNNAEIVRHPSTHTNTKKFKNILKEVSAPILLLQAHTLTLLKIFNIKHIHRKAYFYMHKAFPLTTNHDSTFTGHCTEKKYETIDTFSLQFLPQTRRRI